MPSVINLTTSTNLVRLAISISLRLFCLLFLDKQKQTTDYQTENGYDGANNDIYLVGFV